MDELELNNGIWLILNRYEKNYPFFEYVFQEYYTIKQLFDKFQKIEEISFQYTCIEGFSNCTQGTQSTKFLSPLIYYFINYINMYQIEDLINSNIKKNYNSFML